jgi:hypothetical protein
MVTPIKRTIPEWIAYLHRISFPNEWGVTAFEFVANGKPSPAILRIVPVRFDAAND